MNMLSLLGVLIALGTSRSEASPCDCFTVELAYGYPEYRGYDEICYKYNIEKTGSYKGCPQSLEYFVLDAGDLSCGLEVSDITFPDVVTGSDDDSLVITPFTRGKYDGTYTNGIKIIQSSYNDPESFEICFDRNQVGGTQKKSLIGLKDSNGDGDQCYAYDQVPDFCGGDSPGQSDPSDPSQPADPQDASPSLPCSTNPFSSSFSCDCFNYESNPSINCPRTECVYNYGDNDGCQDLPSVNSGPISAGNPIQCRISTNDGCSGDSVCIDSDNRESGCRTVDYIGVDFGCCKTYPEADDDFETTTEGTPVTINPLINDDENDGDDIRIIDIGRPLNGGDVTPGLNDELTYTPPSGGCIEVSPAESYQDLFTYTIRDSDGLESVGRVGITILCERASPRAFDDDVSINENDENVSIDPLNGAGFDSDPDGDDRLLIINRITSLPNKGEAIIIPSGKDILYTPDSNACDPGDDVVFDEFDYNIIDKEDDNIISNDGTVFITIFCNSDAPLAVNDDNILIPQSVINQELNVLNNDRDPDNPNERLVIYEIVQQPRLGNAIIDEQRTDIFYTPSPDICACTDASFTIQQTSSNSGSSSDSNNGLLRGGSSSGGLFNQGGLLGLGLGGSSSEGILGTGIGGSSDPILGGESDGGLFSRRRRRRGLFWWGSSSSSSSSSSEETTTVTTSSQFCERRRMLFWRGSSSSSSSSEETNVVSTSTTTRSGEILTDTIKYTVVDYFDDQLISNIATVTIRIQCDGLLITQSNNGQSDGSSSDSNNGLLRGGSSSGGLFNQGGLLGLGLGGSSSEGILGTGIGGSSDPILGGESDGGLFNSGSSDSDDSSSSRGGLFFAQSEGKGNVMDDNKIEVEPIDNNNNNNKVIDEPIPNNPSQHNDYISYFVIVLITIISNAIAFSLVYFCCIKHHSNSYGFTKGKVVIDEQV